MTGAKRPRPATYSEVMREAADNDEVQEPTQPAAEHTSQLPEDLEVEVGVDGLVSPDQDVLGFCEDCFRVRWLARIREWKKGFPHGTCRTCEREGQ